jgi:drug/metabolite transporter (DMT)-like permease
LNRVYLPLLLQTFASAGTYLFAKRVMAETGPAELAFLRFLGAGLCFALLLAATGRRVLPPRAAAGRAALLGFIALPVNQGLFLTGLSLSSAAHAAILYALTPALVLVGARLFLGERITPPKAAGVAVAFVGVAVVLFERGLAAETGPLVGDLLVLGAVVAWAAYTILTRPLTREYGAVTGTGWAMIAGAAMTLPLGPIRATHLAQLGGLSATGWLGVAYLVAITSVVSYLLWSYALKRLEAARVAVFTNLQPVATALLSWLILGERIGLASAVGGTLVILGVTASQRR